MRASRLVRTSSLYFHKARALRHTSALLRYNARHLCHQNERAQTLENCEKFGSCFSARDWSRKFALRPLPIRR